MNVQENIGLGNINNIEHLDTVKKAAGGSGAHNFIRTFKSYYQTKLYSDQMAYHYYEQSLFDSYRGGMDLDFHNASSEEIPFMWKMLNNQLHYRARHGEKIIRWFPKPEKAPINVDIPKHVEGDVEEYTDSTNLSGGQWQRIALARAFMRIQEADLLILDEPSSALDPQAEYEVFKSIMDLRKNKTTIYIVSSQKAVLITLVSSTSYRAGGE